MTNEEKATYIANANQCIDRSGYSSFEECEKSALEMAEWKDKQFKECLEKKLKVVKDKLSKTYIWDESCEFVKLQGQMVMLNGIINELFGGE